MLRSALFAGLLVASVACGGSGVGGGGDPPAEATDGGARGADPPLADAGAAKDSGHASTDAPTRTLAHELAEAATDPYTNTLHAYADVGPADLGLRVGQTEGREVGDMCERQFPASAPPELGAKTARIWSNAAARAGNNPCVPVPPGERFFEALAVNVPDTIAVKLPSGNVATGAGFALLQGQSVTIELGLLADGPGPGWTISAHVVDPNKGAGQLSFQLDKTSVNVGDKVTLTVTADMDTTDGIPFAIDSVQGAITHTWYGIVGPKP